MKNISLYTDEELMEGIQNERSECLAELYYRHSSILRGVIFHVLHDHFEADDVLQETFMEIWVQAKAFSPEKGQPLGWMITMTRRRSIDRLRKREAYMRLKDRFLNEPKPSVPASLNDASVKEVILSDTRSFLHKALKSLPEAQKEAVTLAYFSQLSQRQIAKVTDTPLGTVKTRLELGLKKMAAAVGDAKDKIY
jgi:RNA polymerase sigma-70 factor (ECF subfamily)